MVARIQRLSFERNPVQGNWGGDAIPEPKVGHTLKAAGRRAQPAHPWTGLPNRNQHPGPFPGPGRAQAQVQRAKKGTTLLRYKLGRRPLTIK